MMLDEKKIRPKNLAGTFNFPSSKEDDDSDFDVDSNNRSSGKKWKDRMADAKAKLNKFSKTGIGKNVEEKKTTAG